MKRHPEPAFYPNRIRIGLFASGIFLLLLQACQQKKEPVATSFTLEVTQLTSGSKHHFFGYIGQCLTTPWNASEQYVLGMEIDSIHRMPHSDEAATIFVRDRQANDQLIYLDKTHAWNPQQGTMFYWNPNHPESQFFFNDKDTATGEVFTVIYDLDEKKRVQEFRYKDTPIGNGGVAPDGSFWLGLNYGRMSRLRRVTGYSGAVDWSKDDLAPKNDGIFIVNAATGEKRLLVSFFQLDQKIKESQPDLQHTGLFINHTLWDRDSELIYFFARAGWSGNRDEGERVNVPFTIRADGTGLTRHDIFIGGHPEWGEGTILMGSAPDETGTKRQVMYDVEKMEIVGYLGDSNLFPNPEGDISLSPDGNWFVNGYSKDTLTYYTVLRRSDGAWARSEGISKGAYSGDIRIDPAPRWNRSNNRLLVPGMTANGTRQMFMITVKPNSGT
ncbi:hypothetical protein [Cyclobacterium salsum]|uniref:hypothetical protein n=1 Tax=Cyclobacterium salsum TaxID=2666329 RepID=UPI001390BEAB|nr:hypothetical protein [Cyclobacterium salsum]